MIEEIINQALNIKNFNEIQKYNVEEIIIQCLGQNQLTQKSYQKPSLAKMNRKRWKRMNINNNFEKFIKRVNDQTNEQQQIKYDFVAQIDHKPIEYKIKQKLIDSINKEIDILDNTNKELYQSYFDTKARLSFNFTQLKLENITYQFIKSPQEKVDMLYYDSEQQNGIFTQDKELYYNFQNRKTKNIRPKQQVTTLCFCPTNQIYVVGYDDGFIEAFKEAYFNFSLHEYQQKVSDKKICFIKPLKKQHVGQSQFLVFTEEDSVLLIEININNFGLKLGKKTLLKNFTTNYFSVDPFLIRDQNHTFLMNDERILISQIDPKINKIFELYHEQKSTSKTQNMIHVINVKSEEQCVLIDFFIYYDSILKLKQLIINGTGEETDSKVYEKKKFYTKMDLVYLHKFRKNYTIGLNKDFRILIFDHNQKKIVGQIRNDQQFDKFELSKDAFILQQSTQDYANETRYSYFYPKFYQIEEFVALMIQQGNYLQTMQNMLIIQKNQDTSNFKAFIEEYSQQRIDLLVKQVCQNYYKFICFQKPLEENSLLSFQVLVEFIFKGNIIEVLNEFYDELNKNFPQNIDYISESIIKYCNQNNKYNLQKLDEKWINRIIEKAFIFEEKQFIQNMLLQIQFREFQQLEKYMEFLKILQLKLPLIKLIYIENYLDFKVIDTIFQIYLRNDQVKLFVKLMAKIIEKQKIHGYKIQMNFEQELFIVHFFLQKGTLEVFSNYIEQYGYFITKIYDKYLKVSDCEDPKLDQINNSLFYNYFCLKRDVEQYFKIFVLLYEKYEFQNIQKIDSLIAYSFLNIFLEKKLNNQLLSLDVIDLLLNICFRNSNLIAQKNFQALILRTFKCISQLFQNQLPSYNIILEKYFKISEKQKFYELQILIQTLRHKFLKAFNCFIENKDQLLKFNIFEWCKQVILKNPYQQIEELMVEILKNFDIFINYSKKDTLMLLSTFQTFDLKYLKYIDSYPQFQILLIENHLAQNNFLEFEFQEKYLNLLNTINPHIILKALQKYQFDYEKIEPILQEQNNLLALIFVKSLMGHPEALEEELEKQTQIFVDSSSHQQSFKFQQILILNQLYLQYKKFVLKEKQLKKFFEFFSKIFHIINSNFYLLDLDYFHIKALTINYFFSVLKQIQDEKNIFKPENKSYFIKLDTSLLEVILKYLENEKQFFRKIIEQKQNCIIQLRLSQHKILKRGKYYQQKSNKSENLYKPKDISSVFKFENKRRQTELQYFNQQIINNDQRQFIKQSKQKKKKNYSTQKIQRYVKII